MIDLDAYFHRIGYTGAREPTLATLQDLNLRHVCAIPFENLDVLLARGIKLDLASIQRKLIWDRRGGYCFEQNTLFAAVLRALGFEVTTLAARVRWNVPADETTGRTHMTLLVVIDRVPYLVDVGFGGVPLTAPIQLNIDGAQSTSHQTRRIVRNDGVWAHQTWRNNTWLDVYWFTLEPHYAVDYELANWFTSTHPRSRFRQNLIVTRSDLDRHNILANREFTVRHNDGTIERQAVESSDKLLELLHRIFGLQFPAGTRFGSGAAPWPT